MIDRFAPVMDDALPLYQTRKQFYRNQIASYLLWEPAAKYAQHSTKILAPRFKIAKFNYTDVRLLPLNAVVLLRRSRYMYNIFRAWSWNIRKFVENVGGFVSPTSSTLQCIIKFNLHFLFTLQHQSTWKCFPKFILIWDGTWDWVDTIIVGLLEVFFVLNIFE